MLYKHPGVYIEHVPSGLLAIEAASTSKAVFIGPVKRGPVGKPIEIFNAAQFEERFGVLGGGAGGIRNEGENADRFGHAVNAFFSNGGTKAYVLRVSEASPGSPLSEASTSIPNPDDPGRGFAIDAVSEGAWGDALQVRLETTDEDTPPDLKLGYTLEVGIEQDGEFVALEAFPGLSMDAQSAKSIEKVVNASSTLIHITGFDVNGEPITAEGLVGTSIQVDGSGRAPLAGKVLQLKVGEDDPVKILFERDTADLAAVAAHIQATVRSENRASPDFIARIEVGNAGPHLRLASGLLGSKGKVTMPPLGNEVEAENKATESRDSASETKAAASNAADKFAAAASKAAATATASRVAASAASAAAAASAAKAAVDGALQAAQEAADAAPPDPAKATAAETAAADALAKADTALTAAEAAADQAAELQPSTPEGADLATKATAAAGAASIAAGDAAKVLEKARDAASKAAADSADPAAATAAGEARDEANLAAGTAASSATAAWDAATAAAAIAANAAEKAGHPDDGAMADAAGAAEDAKTKGAETKGATEAAASVVLAAAEVLADAKTAAEKAEVATAAVVDSANTAKPKVEDAFNKAVKAAEDVDAAAQKAAQDPPAPAQDIAAAAQAATDAAEAAKIAAVEASLLAADATATAEKAPPAAATALHHAEVLAAAAARPPAGRILGLHAATSTEFPQTSLTGGGMIEAWLSGGGDGKAEPGVSSYNDAYQTLKDYRDVSILLLPTLSWEEGGNNSIIENAVTHCELMKNRMVIVDPPDTSVRANHINTPKDVRDLGAPLSPYTALYYPWLDVANPHYDPDTAANLPKTFSIPPSAFAAGMWARIDGRRGVWKAPAGLEATVRGTLGPNILIGNDLQDNLNEWGVNCLRAIVGPTVIWGARTLATKSKPEFRYVPVRRTQNMIGESLYVALQAVVFEPNDHRLWASLRASVGTFMDGLHRAGAFQGEKASDAYRVHCGLNSTMTQGDVDAGIVRVVVEFAPLKPAEFVVVQIKQIVGRAA